MRLLLVFFLVLIIVVGLLLALLSAKYAVVDAKCVSEEICSNVTKSDGFNYFVYEYNYGQSEHKYYCKLSSITRIKIGNAYKILIVKQSYDERAILYRDILKLIFGVVVLSLLIFVVLKVGFSYWG